MTAHELARKLLEGPDLPVLIEGDTPIYAYYEPDTGAYQPPEDCEDAVDLDKARILTVDGKSKRYREACPNGAVVIG